VDGGSKVGELHVRSAAFVISLEIVREHSLRVVCSNLVPLSEVLEMARIRSQKPSQDSFTSCSCDGYVTVFCCSAIEFS